MTITANGWTIIQMPAPWRFATMDWTASKPTTRNASPFTGQVSQVLEWLGADNWKVTVTSPPLSSEDEARDWTAFVWNAKGGAVAFLLGDPLRRKPRGAGATITSGEYARRSTVNTAIVTRGANAAASPTLNLGGFGANQGRVLQAGDLIAVNYRLYEVCDAIVNADASGNATVTVGPSLREALGAGLPVATHDAQGMFCFAKGDVQWSIDKDHQYTMSFACVEAR